MNATTRRPLARIETCHMVEPTPFTLRERVKVALSRSMSILATTMDLSIVLGGDDRHMWCFRMWWSVDR